MNELSVYGQNFGDWLHQPATNGGVLLAAVLVVVWISWSFATLFKILAAFGSAVARLEQIENSIGDWNHDWRLLHRQELETEKEYRRGGMHAG